MNISQSSHDSRRSAAHASETALAAPRRWHFVVAAVFFSTIAVYGSWVPLNYQPLDFDTAVAEFAKVPYLALRIESRADFVANILLFIPITYFWTAALSLRQTSFLRRWGILGGVVILAAAFSVALEFSQLWFPGRTVSQNDIIAETLGAVVGAVLWLATGRSVTSWLRDALNQRAARGRFDHLLTLYLAGLLIYMVLPLDLTIRPAEIWRKIREGKVVLVPEFPDRFDFTAVYGMLRDVGLWIPVGMWAVVWMLPRGATRRPFLGSIFLAGILLVATEIAQVFVYSRYTSTTDVLLGLVGAAAGVAMMRHLRRGEWTSLDREPKSRKWLSAGYFALALAVAIGVSLYSCQSSQPRLTDGKLIETRFYGMFRVPFAAMYYGTEFNAVGQILWKGGLFALIGGLLTKAVYELRLPQGLVRAALLLALLFATTVAIGIELGQVFIPERVPDVTDILISMAGAALGVFVSARIFGADVKT